MGRGSQTTCRGLWAWVCLLIGETHSHPCIKVQRCHPKRVCWKDLAVKHPIYISLNMCFIHRKQPYTNPSLFVFRNDACDFGHTAPRWKWSLTIFKDCFLNRKKALNRSKETEKMCQGYCFSICASLLRNRTSESHFSFLFLERKTSLCQCKKQKIPQKSAIFFMKRSQWCSIQLQSCE